MRRGSADSDGHLRMSPLRVRFGAFFGWIFVGLLGKSLRYRVIREEILPQYKGGFVVVCWHGQQLIGYYHFRGRGYTILASEHRDGEYTSLIMRRFGWRIVRGSSTRGGVGGLIKLLGNLRRGIPVVLTPDGPRGPIHHIAPGVIYLAKKTGTPIIPVAFAFSRAKYLNTWDEFVLPYPFCRCVVCYGEPVFMSRALHGRENPHDQQSTEEKERLVQALEKTNAEARKFLEEWD